MAVVELPKNAVLGDKFQLLIGLAEIHVPRMWVEQHPESDSRVGLTRVSTETEKPEKKEKWSLESHGT